MKNFTLKYVCNLTLNKALLAMLIVAIQFNTLLFKKSIIIIIIWGPAVAAAISRRQLAQPVSQPNRTKEIYVKGTTVRF